MQTRGLSRRAGTVTAALVVAAGLMLTQASAAFAHDELVTSTPKNGASVAALPHAVVLKFEEPPAPGYTKVSVTGPTGNIVSKGTAVTTGSTVSIALTSTKATGAYTVHWSLLSDDGHPVAGVIRFTVGAPTAAKSIKAPIKASPVAAVSKKTKGAGAEWVLVALLAAGVLVVVFAASRLGGPSGRRSAD